MRKRLLLNILLSVILAFSACQGDVPVENTETVAPVSESPKATPESSLNSETPMPEPSNSVADLLQVNIPDENGIVWIIEPSFEYEKINYCACGYFNPEIITDKSKVETILEESVYDDGTVWLCYGHCITIVEYYFDEEKGNFLVYSYSAGYSNVDFYTAEEFINTNYNHLSEIEATYETYLYVIRKLDADKVIIYDSYEDSVSNYNIYDKDIALQDGYYEYDFSNAATGKFALAYGNMFLTDFIYDYNFKGSRYPDYEDFIELGIDGKWGVLDESANTLIPFIFEEIEFINSQAAFAKIDGKYGIIDFHNSIITK